MTPEPAQHELPDVHICVYGGVYAVCSALERVVMIVSQHGLSCSGVTIQKQQRGFE